MLVLEVVVDPPVVAVVLPVVVVVVVPEVCAYRSVLSWRLQAHKMDLLFSWK